MPIKSKTPQSSINAMVDQRTKIIEDGIIRRFHEIGSLAYNAMRDYSGKAYVDRTGNLRSSSGYIIFKDGKILGQGGFEAVKGEDGSTGEKGAKDGKTFAESLAEKFTQGLVLVLVAGMEYSAAVSALGFNVLDGAALVARIMFNDLTYKLKKR